MAKKTTRGSGSGSSTNDEGKKRTRSKIVYRMERVDQEDGTITTAFEVTGKDNAKIIRDYLNEMCEVNDIKQKYQACLVKTLGDL